ncbi:MAG: UDP-3-O-(3-hydroxymyristoyl)glucosamine N-acyltransferase [Pseudomonadota bacterium]
MTSERKEDGVATGKACTAGDLAVRLGCELIGDPDVIVARVGTLQRAAPDALSFLSNPHYRRYLETTQAAAVIVAPDVGDEVTGTALLASDPYLTYARAAAQLYPPSTVVGGIAPTASVSAEASVDPDASIGPSAVVAAGARVAAGAAIGAGAYIGEGSRIGAATIVEPNVTIMDDVHIGERCTIHAGAVIGTDGFGIAPSPEGWVNVPQIGGVRIGDDVDIGASTSIDRGAIEPTRIGNGVKLDNQIQIGHNTVIGDHTVMAGMVGIAGSTTIGRNCVFGGNSGTVGHLSIADNVVITARCTVTADIKEAGTFGGVFPHEDIRQHQRNVARYRQLDKLARRLSALEKQRK